MTEMQAQTVVTPKVYLGLSETDKSRVVRMLEHALEAKGCALLDINVEPWEGPMLITLADGSELMVYQQVAQGFVKERIS